MRHHKKGRKFGRESAQRKALMHALVFAIVENGKIITTEAKAKELRPYVEKLITHGKHDTLSTRRLLISRLGNPTAVKKIVEVIAPKYKERAGGYTRIVKLPRRMSDGSNMAHIEFV